MNAIDPGQNNQAAPRRGHAAGGPPLPPHRPSSPQSCTPLLHPVTLTFRDAGMERAYQNEHERWWLRLTRFNLVLAALLYCTFGILDPDMFDQYLPYALFIRFGLYLPYNLAVFLLSFYRPAQRFLVALACGSCLIAGFGMVAMYKLANVDGELVFYQGVIQVCAYILVLVRIRFIYVAVLAWMVALAYVVAANIPKPFSDAATLSSTGAVFSVSLICTVASYVMERQIRTAFHARSTLEQNASDLDHALARAQYAQQRAEHLASHDPLTDLSNRRHFRTAAEFEFDRCTGRGLPVSVAVIDIDHFKSVNDRHGHSAGDRVIMAIADILKGSVRKQDILCRYGGEEFVVMFPDTSALDAARLGERIRAVIEQTTIDIIGSRTRVTVSVGISSSTARGPDSLDHLIDQADHALYQAKATGRNRVVSATFSKLQRPA